MSYAFIVPQYKYIVSYRFTVSEKTNGIQSFSKFKSRVTFV